MLTSNRCCHREELVEDHARRELPKLQAALDELAGLSTDYLRKMSFLASRVGTAAAQGAQTIKYPALRSSSCCAVQASRMCWLA